MKLHATIKPYNAGTKSPSFLTEGEKTAGNVNMIDIKPRIQMMLMILGLSINYFLWLLQDLIVKRYMQERNRL